MLHVHGKETSILLKFSIIAQLIKTLNGLLIKVIIGFETIRGLAGNHWHT